MASQLTFLSLDLLPPIALNRTDRMVFPKSEWNNFTLLFRRFTCTLLAHRTTSESSTCHPQWAFSAPPPQQFPASSAALSASLTRQTPPGLWTRPPLRMPLLSSLSGEPLLPFSHLAQGHLFAPMPALQPPPPYPLPTSLYLCFVQTSSALSSQRVCNSLPASHGNFEGNNYALVTSVSPATAV